MASQPLFEGESYARERRERTLSRLRLAGGFALVPIALSAGLNVVVFSDRLAERLLTFAVEALLCLAVLLLARRQWAHRYATPLALGFVLAMGGSLFWAISLSPEDLDVLVGTVIAMMVGSTLLFPWGWISQAIVSGFLAIGYLWILPVAELPSARLVNVGIALANGAILSVVGAFILDRQRRRNADLLADLSRVSRDHEREAKIAAALARAGEELISSLDLPVILERLCRVTTEVMECEASHTLLWQPKEKAFTTVATHGEAPDNAEVLRLLRFSREDLPSLLAGFDGGDVVQVALTDLPEPERTLGYQLGNTVILHMALRRGAEIVGIHTACYRGRTHLFAPHQERIARGVAQLTSMALDNARLVGELSEASRLKSEFVATMSHELRTPLHAILGYGSLLLEGEFGELTPSQAETLREVQRSGERLFELINETLDLGRLEAGRVTLDLREVRIADVLAEMVASLRGPREKRDVELSVEVPSDLPPVRTDEKKLKIVLKNLVENALKFTDRGRVTVGARSRDQGAEIWVADTGIGIPREAQSAIFEAFRQLDGSMTRRHDGIGLGLYIVERMVEILGGRIEVQSEAGRGSTFRVWLPADAGKVIVPAEDAPREASLA